MGAYTQDVVPAPSSSHPRSTTTQSCHCDSESRRMAGESWQQCWNLGPWEEQKPAVREWGQWVLPYKVLSAHMAASVEGPAFNTGTCSMAVFKVSWFVSLKTRWERAEPKQRDLTFRHKSPEQGWGLCYRTTKGICMCDLIVGEEGNPQLEAVTPGQDRQLWLNRREQLHRGFLGFGGSTSWPCWQTSQRGGRRERDQNLNFQFTQALLRSSLQ